MAEIKKKGHNIKINAFILHKISKKQGEVNKAVTHLRDTLLEEDELLRQFVAEVKDAFKTRQPTHGVFDNEIDDKNFQTYIEKYNQQNIDFIFFTQESMKSYKKVINNVQAATGSFMIFVDFNITDSKKERFILVLSIDNQGNYQISDELAIKSILSLNLKDMDLATLININRWRSSIDNDPNIKTYLTFIKGKKQLSQYFQNFIGCADKTTAKESSTKFINTLEEFFNYKKIDNRDEIKTRVFDLCKQKQKDKSEINLFSISELIDPENPDEFSLFASQEEYGVSEIIKYDSKIFSQLKFIEYDSDDLKIKFNRKLFTDEILDYSNGILTIKKIPEDLKKQLDDEFGN